MLFFLQNNNLLFGKPTKRQLKLIYTYSHIKLYTKSVKRRYVKELFKNTLHNYWLRYSSTPTKSLLQSYNQVKPFSDFLSVRSTNCRSQHRLYCTLISYNSNRSLLTPLLPTSDSLSVLGEPCVRHHQFNTKVFHTFLKQLGSLYSTTNFLHFSYLSSFAYQNFRTIRAFSATTAKLTSSVNSRNTLSLIFHNINYL